MSDVFTEMDKMKNIRRIHKSTLRCYLINMSDIHEEGCFEEGFEGLRVSVFHKKGTWE